MLIGVAGYLWGVRADRLGGWPRRRIVLWILGSLAILAASAGPLEEFADTSFTGHMVTHLLLAMVAPLLLVLAAPVTLALRALPVRHARHLSRILASRPLRVLTNPVVAALLAAGGLWVLYTTDLYLLTHHDPVVHAVVHAHLLVSGYLFTAALVSPDPMPHRRSYRVRAAVLVLALAAHDILAKRLYAHPPAGVGSPETGAMVMYYGGDAVELVVMIVLGAGWYRTAGRRLARTAVPRPSPEVRLS